MKKLNIVIFGPSIISLWGNNHATTFRNLMKALHQRGHKITFFEKDVSKYESKHAIHRDLPTTPFCNTILYQSPHEIHRHETIIAQADLVILSSYVTDAVTLANSIAALSPTCFAFYDLDTPTTLAKLQQRDFSCLTPAMISNFDIYFSFTGGRALARLQNIYSAQRVHTLHSCVDPDLYFPEIDSTATMQRSFPPEYVLGYLGNYHEDRQQALNRLLLDPATKNGHLQFCVAGAHYPARLDWPHNVKIIEQISAHQRRHFYNSQRFALTVSQRGLDYSPSVHLFEAGACSTPVITDYWEGLDSFFVIGKEILIAQDADEVLEHLNMHRDDRRALGRRMWEKIMSAHTSTHRAIEIENHWREALAEPQMAAGF